jgi:hypothetical protein
MSKIKVMVLILLGVIALEVNAKPKYRIHIWVDNGTKMYQPQQRVWARIRRFPLPFKVWQPGQYPLKDKESALWVINNWREDDEAKRMYKESEYINININ